MENATKTGEGAGVHPWENTPAAFKTSDELDCGNKTHSMGLPKELEPYKEKLMLLHEPPISK